jgi:hypothetical protein
MCGGHVIDSRNQYASAVVHPGPRYGCSSLQVAVFAFTQAGVGARSSSSEVMLIIFRRTLFCCLSYGFAGDSPRRKCQQGYMKRYEVSFEKSDFRCLSVLDETQEIRG